MLLMQGVIEPGDYDGLIDFAVLHDLNLPLSGIVLSSPGGDVSEALKIGRLVKKLYMEAFVGPEFGQCASACFLIFASAVERYSGAGLVGIHRPYVSPERLRSLSPKEAETVETQSLLEAEEYLHQLRVPGNMVDTMFEHASTQIHWLSDDELINQLGRRAMWYEEFLIARCGLNKSLELRAADAYDDNKRSLSEMRIAVNSCRDRLVRSEAQANYKKAITAASADHVKQAK